MAVTTSIDMTAHQARRIAQAWVESEASQLPGFVGAYLTGSIVGKCDGAPFSRCSDIDILVVLDATDPPPGLGKFVHDGAILEVNFTALKSILDRKAILADYRRASAFREPSVIYDPSGRITALQQAIGRDFDRRQWVIKRCDDALGNASRYLAQIADADSLHDRVTCLFFSAGACCHLILVAALQNPTVRRRYAASHSVLKQHGRLDFQERLLATLGSHHLSAERVTQHLSDCGDAFDLACFKLRSTYRFASDMTTYARPTAIDVIREMIDAGYHREAVFWIVAVFCRSRAVVSVDGTASDLQGLDDHLQALLASLGLNSTRDREERVGQIEKDMRIAWQVAMEIIETLSD